MDLIDKFQDIKKRFATALSVFNGGMAIGNAEDAQLGIYAPWMYSAIFGQARGIDINTLRSFASSSWVQMVTRAIIKAVEQTPWEIVTIDPDDDIKNYESDVKKIKEFFRKVNRDKENIMDIWKVVLKDILEIDAGTIAKGRNGNGVLKELWSRDASTFVIQRSIYGPLIRYWQYSFRQPNAIPIPFEPEDLIYSMENKSSYSAYGFSPLQSVQQVVDLLIQSTRYNREYYKNNAIPNALLSLPNADQGQISKFKANWLSEVKGKAHKFMFHNVPDLKIDVLNANNKDMEWLDGQKWYMHLVFGIYGASPVESGFFEDVNRSSGGGQERINVRNAVKPRLKLLENDNNKHIIPDLLGQEFPKVKFKFMPKDHEAEKIQEENDIKAIEAGALTINEYRAQKGLQPVEWGDEPPQKMSFNLDSNKFPTNSPPPKEGDSKKDDANAKNEGKKSFSKKVKKDLDPGEDIVEESEDYETWLLRLINSWETKIITAVEREPELSKAFIETKALPDLFARVFNVINTFLFSKQLKNVIKNPMKAGLEAAEQDTNLDIGVSMTFNQTADFFADQQFNGYTLPDGKRWHGIKGATQELRLKILDEIKEGVVNKEGQADIVKRIKEVFTKVKDGQAVRIARTESTRFVNEGKLQGIRDANVEGFKVWKAIHDGRSSEICKRMNGQKVEVGTNFKDSKTLVEFAYPPAHVNCRSTFQWVPN